MSMWPVTAQWVGMSVFVISFQSLNRLLWTTGNPQQLPNLHIFGVICMSNMTPFFCLFCVSHICVHLVLVFAKHWVITWFWRKGQCSWVNPTSAIFLFKEILWGGLYVEHLAHLLRFLLNNRPTVWFHLLNFELGTWHSAKEIDFATSFPWSRQTAESSFNSLIQPWADGVDVITWPLGADVSLSHWFHHWFRSFSNAVSAARYLQSKMWCW
jgi:hypothetical protein